MEEPKVLIHIKEHKSDGVFDDVNNEIILFLQSQFNYEMNRIPHHRLFKTVYQLDYFDASMFLNYWVYPTGFGLFQYKIDEYSQYSPLIYKKAVASQL